MVESSAALERYEGRAPAIPPALEAAGVAMVVNEQGYRTLGFPPEARTRFNVLTSVTEVSQANPNFVPVARITQLRVQEHCYDQAAHLRDGQCSLNKLGLISLAKLAGVTVTTELIPRAQLSDTQRVGWRATASQRHSDGTVSSYSGSYIFDDEVEREEIEAAVNSNAAKYNWSADKKQQTLEQRWRVKRKHASALAETLAIERAIRLVLELKHVWTKQELEKPFVVVTYAFMPSDQETRQAAASALASLYGADTASAPALPAGPPSYGGEDEPLPLPAAAPLDSDEGAAATSPAAAPSEPSVSMDDEPVEVVSAEDTVVVNGNGDADPAEVQAAGLVKPPGGSYQKVPLAEIVAKGAEAEKWLEYALRKDWQGHPFGAAVHTFVRAEKPDFYRSVVGGEL